MISLVAGVVIGMVTESVHRSSIPLFSMEIKLEKRVLMVMIVFISVIHVFLI